MTALVHFAQESTEYETANSALTSHGLPDLTGQTILIRPNVVATNNSPYATHIEVVRAVIDAVKTAGASASDITIGERSDGAYNTNTCYAACGYDVLASEEGINLVSFADEGFTTQNTVDMTEWPSGIEYADRMLSADYIIAIPVAKHHLFANNFTAGIKGMMGGISQSDTIGRIWAHGPDAETGPEINERVPQIWFGAPIDLFVLDATHICLTNGPFGIGDEGDPMIVVVTTDPVACDVAAMGILKHWLVVETVSQSQFDGAVWDQPLISESAGQIGISSNSAFTYKDNGVSEIADIIALTGGTEEQESQPTSMPSTRMSYKRFALRSAQ